MEHLLVVVQPFAEEANKSRHTISQLAAALNKQAVGVALIDFTGSGDSEGDFVDADLDQWAQDLSMYLLHLGRKFGCDISLLAIRAGAITLLQSLLAKKASEIESGESFRLDRLFLVNPAFAGKVYMTQFMRMRLAAGMISGGRARETMSDLIEEYESTGKVEIAGYSLSKGMIEQFEQASLSPAVASGLKDFTAIHVVNVQPSAKNEISPAAKKQLAILSEVVGDTRWVSVEGETFWATQEISSAPGLVAYVCNAFKEKQSQGAGA